MALTVGMNTSGVYRMQLMSLSDQEIFPFGNLLMCIRRRRNRYFPDYE